jgi:hypothetical protein
MSHGELEKECAGLHATVDTLKQEEAQIKTDCELKLRRSKKNQDYCIGHRKRLHELHANLEKAVNEIPNNIVKLTARNVKRWWTSHGLPYMTDAFRVELEVGMFISCCSVWRFLVLTFVSLSRCRRSVLAWVDHESLLTPEVHPHALARTA